MSAHWYFYKDGREQGPFTPKQFKALAVAGEVQPADRVRKDGERWVEGTKIEGLFPEEPVSRPRVSKVASLIEAENKARRGTLVASFIGGTLAVIAGIALLVWLMF
jgi:hypothetical protein